MVTLVPIKWNFFSFKLSSLGYFPHFLYYFLIPIPPLYAFHIHSTHCRPRHSYYRSDCLFPVSPSSPSLHSFSQQPHFSPVTISSAPGTRQSLFQRVSQQPPDRPRLPVPTISASCSTRWRPDGILTNSRLTRKTRSPNPHVFFASTRDLQALVPKHSTAGRGTQTPRLIDILQHCAESRLDNTRPIRHPQILREPSTPVSTRRTTTLGEDGDPGTSPSRSLSLSATPISALAPALCLSQHQF